VGASNFTAADDDAWWDDDDDYWSFNDAEFLGTLALRWLLVIVLFAVGHDCCVL
jgi:hypothetical protein